MRWDESNSNETDKFFAKYNAIPELKIEVQKLLSFVLDSIGDDHGAIDILFNRFEQEVVGLPNKGKVNVKGIVFLYPQFSIKAICITDKEPERSGSII
ncbi:MAG: hypothetical protein J0H29_02210 [Sphingobacteriales bacterium]|nr:hypothetical protein [Sphingobacteriales bacterium]OJY87992.1 MAG: hypothetical protein BGP14_21360 [Sphingobacteriales bacterium 44-15]